MTDHSPIVYLNGEYLALDSAHISPLDRGFLFGDGVYEVVKCFKGVPFYYAAHQGRLRDSLTGLRIPLPSEVEFLPICRKLIEDNQLQTEVVLIYLQITRGAYMKRSHEFPDEDIKPTVFAMATVAPQWDSSRGIKLISDEDSRWRLCRFKTVNLLGNVLSRQLAVESGAQEVVLIRDGVPLECSSSALTIVQDGKIVTHPPADYVLPSISLVALKDICAAKKIPYVERPFGREELRLADEVLVLSSAFEVRYATTLDDKPVGKSDKMYQLVRQAFEDLTTGQAG